MIEQTLGLPLQAALDLLRANGVERIESAEYRAPGRDIHGEDYRVIQARLHEGCAKLVYAGFNTSSADAEN